MSILLSHPTGNTFSRAAAEAFHHHGILSEFHTCVATGDGAQNPITQKLYQQRYCAIPNAQIRTQPLRELLRLFTQKLDCLSSLRTHETGALSVDKVYQNLDQKVSQVLASSGTSCAAVYAYEDGALYSFQAAKQRDIRCIYDLPIGYWRAARTIQTEEAELQPEWAATMPALRDSAPKLERKDQELQLADAIIVASKFTAQTLQDAPFELPKPRIIPYGCPTRLATECSPTATNTPLKVLYVGGLTQRKGLAYLLQAAEHLGQAIELTIVGKRVAQCRPLDAALQTHHWIDSLPHTEILHLMHQQDVLVFPSLFEGFGLVLTEALSQGIPIIATPHTCATDIIEDGKEGIITPIRDADAICHALETLHLDRERLHTMKENALERAAAITWKHYQAQLVQAVKAVNAQ